MKLFIGYDQREAVGLHAFIQSVVDLSSIPVSITPLTGNQQDGSNAFTYSRFRIPSICGYEGWAVWMDGSDMLLRADLAELQGLMDGRFALQVVKHDYLPKNGRKYIGTEMESMNIPYPRKNWSSVILWNCGHPANRHIGGNLHRFEWLSDELIGDLPIEWNWLADEYGYNERAKLLHWTNGIPGFTHYHQAPHAHEWRDVVRKMQKGLA